MLPEIEKIIDLTKTWTLRWRLPTGRYGVYQCENCTVKVIVSCCAPSDYYMVINGEMLNCGIADLKELCEAIVKQIRDRKNQKATVRDRELLRRVKPVRE